MLGMLMLREFGQFKLIKCHDTHVCLRCTNVSLLVSDQCWWWQAPPGRSNTENALFAASRFYDKAMKRRRGIIGTSVYSSIAYSVAQMNSVCGVYNIEQPTEPARFQTPGDVYSSNKSITNCGMACTPSPCIALIGTACTLRVQACLRLLGCGCVPLVTSAIYSCKAS
jgi:hypothetical protein